MYNSDLKSKFISGYTYSEHSVNLCKSVFDSVEKYEEELGKDICTFTKEEIGNKLESLCSIRTKGYLRKLKILRDYADWCLSSGIKDATDSLKGISIDGVDQMREKMLASPAHLQSCLDIIFDPEEDHTVHNMYRAIAWLAYSGMAEEDMVLVRKSDIDFSNLVIRFNGREYPLYREAIPCIRICCESEQFITYNGTFKVAVWKPRAQGDKVLRGTGEKETMSVINTRNAIRRCVCFAKENGKQGVKDICYIRLFLSGVFYRMRERELCGMPVNFGWMWQDKVFSSKKASRDAEADMVEDYERWKAAFRI